MYIYDTKTSYFSFSFFRAKKRLYLFRLIIKASKMVTRQALTNAFYLLSSFRLCIGVTKPLEIIVNRLVCFCVCFFPCSNTMAEISISIEIKYFGGDNNIIATINIKPWINWCIFMYLKWQWLLRFFAKML